MNERPPASIALEELGIPHRVFRHPGLVASFEQAASERGQRPEQIVRSILFQVRAGEFVMVLMAGQEQVDWRSLRKLVGRSRVRMATEEEVLGVTGYRIGTVSPFGMRNQAPPESDRHLHPVQVKVKILIDASVLKEEEISIGSGVHGTAILMKSVDLRKALADSQVVALTEEIHPS